MKKTVFFVGLAALLVCIPVTSAALQTFEVYQDPSGNPVVFETQGKRTYINIGGSVPTYDPASDQYSVPAVIGEEVSVPDPARAAQGDATTKPVIVGNPVVMKLPGTDLVKLADGTWTNTTPSSTLASAAVDSSNSQPTYDNVPYFDQVGQREGYFTLPGGYRTSVSFRQLDDIVRVTFSSPTVYSSNGFSCQDRYGRPDGFYFHPTLGSYAYACVGGVPSDGGVIEINFTPFDSGHINPAATLTSASLANALLDALNQWSQNGLADDFRQVAENGSPTTDGLAPSSQDIQDWIGANGKAVKEAISSGIRDGFGTSITDGTNTGAQEQTSGQLTGIQDTLNGISDKLDDIKDDGKSYAPESQTNDYAPDTSLNNTSEFTDRFNSFADTVKATSLFSLPDRVLFNIPNSSTSIYTINMGGYGTADIDFAPFGSALTIFRTALLICFSYASIRIAATGK